ncbi:MarR family transcriptional regulator [Mycobacterium branderi]|nr:MarR family transcriptional regulator [Mycobacterium branderi]MCV7231800.1 MarR family transcriptional regulator [Mycobacterium branderi]ORA40450.1 MarR family transcriptional regulator [Mycobacterium branderi]
MLELQVLQAVRLKGRIAPADLQDTVGGDAAAVAEAIASLKQSGLVSGEGSLRLSADGRARLNELLTQERTELDVPAVAAAYDEFRSVNAEFKALVADWQLRDGSPNMHDDADYDAAVLARLEDVHARALPVIAAAATQLPRLARYGEKLSGALDKVRAGDTTWLARPVADSYHTVWFELHEELIAASGLTREDEATAGHA